MSGHRTGSPARWRPSSCSCATDIAIANIGHRGAAFAPYIMTLFFFILYGNLLGLLPWGASATGNLAVTAGLAVMALVVIEVSGMVALGFNGYMRTIFPPIPGMKGPAAVGLSIAMSPIELLGKLGLLPRGIDREVTEMMHAPTWGWTTTT